MDTTTTDIGSVQVAAEEGAMAASLGARCLERATFTDGRVKPEERREAIQALEEASEKVNDALVALEGEE